MRLASFFAIVFAIVGLGVTKAPYMQLAAKLVSGDIDGTPIPVMDSEPTRFQEETVSMRCGALVFEVPAHAHVEPPSAVAPTAIYLEIGRLNCTIFPPRQPDDADDELSALAVPEGTSGKDIVALRTAVCRASRQDLSFWMTAEEIGRLQRQLELRPLYCLGADRAEVVRGQDACGLLLMWTGEGRLQMLFEYVSSNGRFQGNIAMLANVDCDETRSAARAILNSLQLEPAANR